MKALCALLCLLCCCCCSVHAQGVQALEDAIGLNDLEEAAGQVEMMPDVSVTSPGSLGQGIGDILERSSSYAGGYLQSALKTAAITISIVLLCALVRIISPKLPMSAVSAAGALAITAACAGSLGQMVGLGTQTVQDIQLFSNALLPAMAAAAVASGAPVTSSAVYVATVLLSDMTLLIFTGAFIPLIYAYVVTAAADAALDSDLLSRIGGLCKWIVSSGLKVILTGYLGWLTVTGIINGSADAAAIKAAKLALSTAVPVVGSIISDASETVLVSAQLLKNGIGVFGMLAVLSISILPFLKLGIHYLVFKGAAAISGCLGGGGLSRLVDALSTAMGMLLGITGVCALMLMISMVCSMKAVTG